MVDFAQARRTMVDGQVRTSDVTDLRLIAAMLDVPREAFVPAALLTQLKDGGRLVAVIGSGPMGKATIFRKSGGHATGQTLFDATAPLLPGFAKPAAFVF